MPNDPLNDPLLRSPRSFVPTIPAMTEAAAAATPEQLADFVDAIGAAGGGGGGGGGGGNATNLGVVASPTGVTVTSDSGADAVLPLSDGTNAGLMAPAQHNKLAGVAAGATANATDAQLRDRSTHTGTQAISTVTGLQAALDGKAALVGGKLDPSQVPDIALQQYLGAVASEAAMLALAGQLGDWCTRSDTGTDWRIVGNPATLAGWLQTAYPSAPVVSVAGKTGSVTLVKGDVGLGNVDNTADTDKPVSTAQATAIGAKMDATMTALQSVFDGGTTAQKATFQYSVSGYLGNPRILAIGDSITNDGWLTTASPQTLYSGGTYTAGGVTAVRTEDHGFVAQASALLGTEIINKGIAGNTIQQVIDRLATDVGPYKPGIVIDNSVTNSLFGTAADAMTEDQLFDFLVAQKTTCIEYYRGIGARIVIPECLPRSSFTTRQNRVAARYNRWLRTLPELQNWIRVVPVAALFSDPAVYGSATPAPRWTRDGTHPNNVGAMRYGRALVNTLGDWVKSVALYPSLMDVRGGFGTSAIVRNTNPLMGLGSGGTLGTGATGSVAAEYTINRLTGSPNIACSMVTDADGYQRQRLTVDFLAAGDAIWFGISPASGVWDTTRASLLSCAADVDIVSDGPEIINSLLMYTTANVGGTTYTSTCLNQNTQSIAARGNLPTGRGVSLKLRSPRIYVPTGTCTTYQTQLRVSASAAGQVTFDVGRFYKLQEVSPI